MKRSHIYGAIGACLQAGFGSFSAEALSRNGGAHGEWDNNGKPYECGGRIHRTFTVTNFPRKGQTTVYYR